MDMQTIKDNMITFCLLFVFLLIGAGSFYFYNIVETQERNTYINYMCCYALCKDEGMDCSSIDTATNEITCIPDGNMTLRQKGLDYIMTINIFEVKNKNICNTLNQKYQNFSNSTIIT